MFAQRLFSLISRLVFSHWAHGYDEHHSPYEDTYVARFGRFHLEINRCFVLDHDDAQISIRIPTPLRHAQGWHWGKLHVGYVVCQGEDEIRQPGFYSYWQKQLPIESGGNVTLPDGDDDFAF